MQRTTDPSVEPVRAGVVGVGNMGRHHARVYNELPGVTLAGVHDVDEERAKAVAADYATSAYTESELFANVDVVSIVVPTEHHYELTLRAIENDVDVLVEKPFVADPSQGQILLELARRKGCTIQVGHVERFNPAIVALDAVVPDLDVIAVTARRLGPPIDRSVGDSVVMDLMIHDLDVVLSLLDESVESVAAFETQGGQHVSALLSFENGVIGDFTASRVTQQKVRTLSITAAECQVNVDYVNRSVDIHRHSLPSYIEHDGDVRYRHESIVERPTVDNGEPLKKELAAFVEAARTGTEPLVSGEEALRALELARMIERRAANRPEATVR